MSQTRSIYKDYVLSCRAMKQDCGAFRASVAMICVGGNKTMSQQFLDLVEHFPNEVDAVEHARCAGIEWIEANAKIDRTAFYPLQFLERSPR
jgi:hypothetical protein